MRSVITKLANALVTLIKSQVVNKIALRSTDSIVEVGQYDEIGITQFRNWYRPMMTCPYLDWPSMQVAC